MTAAIDFPTLRLIRYQVGELSVQGLAPGEHRELTPIQIRDAFGKVAGPRRRPLRGNRQ